RLDVLLGDELDGLGRLRGDLGGLALPQRRGLGFDVPTSVGGQHGTGADQDGETSQGAEHGHSPWGRKGPGALTIVDKRRTELKLNYAGVTATPGRSRPPDGT